MFNLIRSIIATLIVSLTASVAFADVTVKVRQTAAGQSFENTTYIKGKRERTEQDMGGFKTVSIRQCDMKKTIQLNPMTKMYLVESWAQDESLKTTSTSTVSDAKGTTKTEVRKGGVVTITMSMRDTGERKQMFGFTARHIILTMQMESSADSCGGEKKTKVETDGWYIDADFALDCNDNLQIEMPVGNTRDRDVTCKDRQVVKNTGSGKLGYPVYEKITMFDESGKPAFSTVKEVLNLSFGALDASLFEVPVDYRLAKNQEEMFSGAGMFGAFDKSKMPVGEDTSADTEDDGVTDRKSEVPAGEIKSSTQISQKAAGVIRIGLAGVKTGPVGDGVNAQRLAGATQTSFGSYFKGTGIEIVLMEAKLPGAVEQEAKNADCDFVLYVQVSHKRGGGGFGALRSIGGVLGGAVPYGGGVGGAIATETARVTIWTAADAAADIKAKDELTLEVNLKKTDGSAALKRQFKSKANSEGEDIISSIVEQSTQVIVDFVKK